MNPIFVNFTLKECEDILAIKFKQNNYTVTSFEFCPLRGLGFLGDHAILKISFTGNTENLQFFAKAMCFEESQQIFLEEGGGFYKECGFFKQLLPEFAENNIKIMSDCVPACYTISNMNYIICEDLNAKDYRSVSPRESMSLECVYVCLQTLAKLHCTALINEEIVSKRTGNTYKLIEEYPDLFRESFYNSTESSMKIYKATKTGIVTLIDVFIGNSETNSSTFKELACKVVDDFQEIVKPSTIFKNTICHGDLWASNIMFKFTNGSPVDCCFVDFQTYRYAPPAQDLMGFIYLSTNRKFREKYMDNVIVYYYKKVTEQLREYNLDVAMILPYEEFRQSCNHYKLFAITQTLGHFPHILLSKEQVKAVSDMPGGMQKLLFKNKADVILKICSEDDIYRERLHDSVIDLREQLVEQNMLNLK